MRKILMRWLIKQYIKDNPIPIAGNSVKTEIWVTDMQIWKIRLGKYLGLKDEGILL